MNNEVTESIRSAADLASDLFVERKWRYSEGIPDSSRLEGVLTELVDSITGEEGDLLLAESGRLAAALMEDEFGHKDLKLYVEIGHVHEFRDGTREIS